MGYPAQQGIAISILHPVRDINGAYVAGQAAAVTKNLIKPDRTVDAATAVTKTDLATGWVQATAILPLLGTYTLELTNPEPPTADGRISSYDIVVSPGIVVSTQLLTSRDRVRTRMQLAAGNTALDSLIDLLISEVSDEYQNRTGRTFVEASYVHYLDGAGRQSLVLPAGPLVSLSLLESVEYKDDGAGGVTEVRTTVAPHTYVLAGLRTQPRYLGRGRVDLVGRGAEFTPGARNYRATYVAGFASVPEGVVGKATEDVVYRVMTRETGHLLSQMMGDGSITYMRPAQVHEMREEFFNLYQLEAA